MECNKFYKEYTNNKLNDSIGSEFFEEREKSMSLKINEQSILPPKNIFKAITNNSEKISNLINFASRTPNSKSYSYLSINFTRNDSTDATSRKLNSNLISNGHSNVISHINSNNGSDDIKYSLTIEDKV